MVIANTIAENILLQVHTLHIVVLLKKLNTKITRANARVKLNKCLHQGYLMSNILNTMHAIYGAICCYLCPLARGGRH